MSEPLNSGNMYFISVTSLPQKEGINLAKFIQKVANIFSDDSSETNVVYKFKVCGEPKLIFIVKISNLNDFERTIAAVWLHGAVQVECLPIISYESFARSIKVAESLAQPSKGFLANGGLYWLDFNVDYHGKTTKKLIKIWKKEAEAVFAARHKGGTSIELYKCVAQRKVHAFINAPSHGHIDALSLQLPLMLENGANVQLKCKALQFLDDYTSFVAGDSILS